jgi:hypothetical protein
MPFPKLSGNGAMIIDYTTKTKPEVTLLTDPDAVLPVTVSLGLVPQANGRVEISAAGWKVTKINQALPAVVELLPDPSPLGLDRPHWVADGLTMIVDSGVTLNVKNLLAVVTGGTLDVRGSINVSSAEGNIIIGREGKDYGGSSGPSGKIRIEGTVTVDNGGMFLDENVDYTDVFLFPAYDGGGRLIIKNTGTSGNAIIGDSRVQPIVSDGGLLKLDPGATFEIGKRSSQFTYKLTGGAKLVLPDDIKLKGEFTLNTGTNTLDTELTVEGGKELTMDFPNSLVGPGGSTINQPKIIMSAGTIIMKKQDLSTDTLEDSKNYIWSPPKWKEYTP